LSDLPLYLTNGLVLGLIYALSALGVSLVAGTMRIVNFAHGEFYVAAAYLSYTFCARLGLPPLAAMALAILCAFLLGVLTEELLIRPTYGRPMQALIVTFVLSIVLQNALLLIFGPYPVKPPALVAGATELFGLFTYGRQRLMSLGIAAALIAAVFGLVQHTWLGLCLRAVASDRKMASMLGVNEAMTHRLAFGLGAALAGAAGVTLAPVFPVTSGAGSEISLSAFVVVVLGGLGSLEGCLAGGVILGLAENLGAAYLSTMYRPAFGFLLLILVLTLKPTGLYGKKAL
jgi:branched-chain amino acid transport system permease protein